MFLAVKDAIKEIAIQPENKFRGFGLCYDIGWSFKLFWDEIEYSRSSRKRTPSGARNCVRKSWPLTRMSKYKVYILVGARKKGFRQGGRT